MASNRDFVCKLPGSEQRTHLRPRGEAARATGTNMPVLEPDSAHFGTEHPATQNHTEVDEKKKKKKK